jgi:hypothetical protein
VTFNDLLKLGKTITDCHPEARDAEVWAVKGKHAIHIKFVGYDKKHKPNRIKLEE